MGRLNNSNGTTKRYFPSITDRARHKKFLKVKGIEDSTVQQVMYQTLNSYTHITYTNNDEKNALYLVSHNVIRKNNKTFVKTKILSYILYDKKLKKIASSQHIDYALYEFISKNRKNTKWEWLFNYIESKAISPSYMISALNNKLKTKIYEGKITNLKSLNTEYLKSVKFDGFVSFDTLISFIRSESFNESFATTLNKLRISTNPEKDIDFISGRNNPMGYQINDLFIECVLLNEKISYRWSKKRLEDLHTKLSKKVAALKRLALGGDHIKYKSIYTFKNPKFKLLTTHIEFADEGDEMSHCLFSNDYFNTAINKKIFIVSFRDESIQGFVGKGTAELTFSSITNRIVIKQFRGRFNREIYRKVSESNIWNDSTVNDTLAYQELENTLNDPELIEWCVRENIRTNSNNNDEVQQNLILEDANYLPF